MSEQDELNDLKYLEKYDERIDYYQAISDLYLHNKESYFVEQTLCGNLNDIHFWEDPCWRKSKGEIRKYFKAIKSGYLLVGDFPHHIKLGVVAMIREIIIGVTGTRDFKLCEDTPEWAYKYLFINLD